VDLDLGNYERWLDITLRRDNNLTTGKIYQVRGRAGRRRRRQLAPAAARQPPRSLPARPASQASSRAAGR
jgi:hypothetical protein